MENIFLILVVFLLTGILSFLAARKIEFGAFIFLMVTYVINPLFISAYNRLVILKIGTITINQNDPIVFILLIAVIIRILKKRVFNLITPYQRVFLLLFVGLVFLSTMTGYFKFGEGGFADARRYFIVIAPLLYFASFKYSIKNLQNLGNIIILSAVLSSLGGLVKWLFWGFSIGSSIESVNYTDIRRELGISTTGIILLIALIIIVIKLIRDQHNQILKLFLLSLFLGMIVLLQERTLWFITLFMMIYFLLRYKGKFIVTIIPVLIALLILSLSLYIFNVLHLRQTFSGIFSAFKTIQGPNSTFSWRVEGWLALLKNLSWYKYVTGSAFGSGYERLVMGQIVNYNPHSFYVTNIVRIGLFGLFAYVLSHLFLLSKMRDIMRFTHNRIGKYEILNTVTEIIMLALISNLLTSITYNLSQLGGAIWGVGIAFCSSIKRDLIS